MGTCSNKISQSRHNFSGFFRLYCRMELLDAAEIEAVRQMDLAQSYMGFEAQSGQELDLNGYPLTYRLSYRITGGLIGSVGCLLVAPKGTVKLVALINTVRTLQADHNVPCVVLCHKLSAYQARRLTDARIAWIQSDNSYYLPFLGISIREADFKKLQAKPLSRKAQRIAAHIIDGSWDGKSTTDVAELLGVSLASASNYFKEIAAIAPVYIGTQGRRRFISVPRDCTPRQLFDEFEPYLASPVQERAYLAPLQHETSPKPDGTWLYSGVTELSRLTLLEDNPWKTIATDLPISSFLEQHPYRYEIVTCEDDPGILIESWPGGIDAEEGCVNKVQLYLSLREEADEDPRLEGALDKLWERMDRDGR